MTKRAGCARHHRNRGRRHDVMLFNSFLFLLFNTIHARVVVQAPNKSVERILSELNKKLSGGLWLGHLCGPSSLEKKVEKKTGLLCTPPPACIVLTPERTLWPSERIKDSRKGRKARRRKRKLPLPRVLSDRNIASCPFSSKAGLRVRFFFCARWCAMGCSLGGKREKRARTTRMRASAKNLVEMCVCTE